MNVTDVLIVGSGVAALQLAKELRNDINVTVITKSVFKESNSYLAQGGIAAALHQDDLPEKHFYDTIEAGRFHNDPAVVDTITKAAPSLIGCLIEEGCPFDRDARGQLLFGMEGAHSEKRIVHGGGDATGKTLIDFLWSQMKDHVEVIEDLFVYELIKNGNRVVGVKGKHQDERVETIYASHIILATGGCGQLYTFTSNAETVTGDGVALAYLAGAEIVDMEFIQFHPTMLYMNGTTHGLVSEAVRGEGGRLVTADGFAIMDDVHPLKDLAPRHIVSQTIYQYVREGKQIFLNVENVKDFTAKFPTITQLCLQQRIDVMKGMIPVVPGSHFLMGGIKTDLLGRTNIPGLYAIGEVACTGFHGANRLASNSLLEGLFMGKKLAEWFNAQEIVREITCMNSKSKPPWLQKELPSIADIQQSMMENVGIVRNQRGLEKQKSFLDQYDLEGLANVDFYYATREMVARSFMLLTASLITNAALERTESRGGHFREDYPEEDDRKWLRRQIVHVWERMRDDEPVKIKTAT